MKEQKFALILNGTRCVLESFYLTLFVMIFGLLCWFFEWTSLVVIVFAVVFILVLLFAKDLKNMFAPLLYISFFIPDIRKMTDYTVYFVVVGLAVATLLGFFIVKVIKNRKNANYGRLAVGLLACSLAFVLGGIFISFNWLNSLMIFGFCLAIYILYYISVNHTTNLKEYLEKLFIIGGFIVCFQVVYFVQTTEMQSFFSAQGVNTAALFIVLGIIACFTMALKAKLDFVFYIFALILSALVVFTKCRVGMFLAVIFDVFFTVILFVKAKHKKTILLTLLVVLVAFIIAYLLSGEFKEFVQSTIFGKKGLSGREKLWTWCLELFREEPVMGYGFFYDGEVPTLRTGSSVILAHNTLVQWIACLGIIGCAFMIVFYINKYLILFKGFNLNNLFALSCVIMLEMSGMLDQAANMDVFVVLISILLVASNEKQEKVLKETQIA